MDFNFDLLASTCFTPFTFEYITMPIAFTALGLSP